MNILFILGNGFDLQLGLPTHYSDFYEYYKSVPSESDEIKALKISIADKKQEWADLELQLGMYSKKIEDASVFCNLYDDVQIELKNYLMMVDKMIQGNKIQLDGSIDSITRGFKFPEEGLSMGLKSAVNAYVAEHSKRPDEIKNVHVLSFNYTHTCEYVKEQAGIVDASYQDPNHIYINDILHIHQELSEAGSIWLGVDNEAQIANENFRRDDDIRLRLIKPEILSERGTHEVIKAKYLISNADIICLFGLSLGETDTTWVKVIAQSISRGVLTLFFVKTAKAFNTENAEIAAQKKIRQSLMDRFKELGVTCDNLNNVHVVFNSRIFKSTNKESRSENREKVLDSLGVVR